MSGVNKSGIIFTLVGAVLWGVSGTCAQYLQQTQHINTEWLTTVRLLIAGSITVIGAYIQGRGTIFRIFKSPIDVLKLIVFGILGIGLCQYTYFKAVFYAGAGIATVLQYIAPIFIILYIALVERKMPSIYEKISVVLAFVGTVLIALHGNFSMESLNGPILFWGLLSAVAVSIYTMEPVGIIRKYGTGPVVGFGMLIGGITGWLLWQPSDSGGIWDLSTYFALYGGVILLGTVISFNAYMEGVKWIGPVKASVIASSEPVSAALLGWFFLGNTFTVSDIIGFMLILSTIFILAKEKSDT